MMSISSHKIGGPQGVGALIVQEKLPIKSFIYGGGQEIGRRGGTENIAGIVGFGRAVSMIKKSLKKMEVLEIWRNEIEEKIRAQLMPVLKKENKAEAAQKNDTIDDSEIRVTE